MSIKNPETGIRCVSGGLLKILAMAFMLIDHIEGTLVFDQDWMTCLGRLAFPIFAFQVAQGYEHTGNFKQYVKRMFLFALISEIPYNLMHGNLLYPTGQNVLFTFCLSLVVIWIIDLGRKKGGFWGVASMVGAAFPGSVLADVLRLDYGGNGVLLVLSFWIFVKVPLGWLWQLLTMIYINGFAMNSATWTLLHGTWALTMPVQAFAVLSIIPIGLYNGKQGPPAKGLQKVTYWFYPVHMLLLAGAAFAVARLRPG